jgi:uncharacterized small protein (DUF1192 family)
MTYGDTLSSLRSTLSNVQHTARLECDARVNGLSYEIERLDTKLRELGAPDLRAARTHHELLATIAVLQDELAELEHGRSVALRSIDRLRAAVRDLQPFVRQRALA